MWTTIKGTLGVVAAIIVVSVVFWAGMSFEARHHESVVVEADTVYVDRPLAPKDTANASRPYVVHIYEPEERTLPVENLEVPERLLEDDGKTPRFWGIDRNAVHIKHDRVSVFAYDFATGRNVRLTYAVPRPNFDWGLDATTDYYGPGELFLGVSGRLSYKGLELNIGPALNPLSGHVGVKIGVRYELWRR